jgi:aminocarboxymuconate-semialdehyde decarboxylase
MTVIDVHTHMYGTVWLDRIRRYGAPHYTFKELHGQLVACKDGAPFMTTTPPMFDAKLRIRDMDVARVDLAVISLTSPSVFWGGEEVSAETARLCNDEMAEVQRTYPDRIRWFASLPWQYPARAVAELERAHAKGAAGVFVSANVDEQSLTAPRFAPIWDAIDAKALPVLVHPTTPPGVAQLDMARYNLVASIGFTFDTSLAVARMIYDGFFDRYTRLKIIAAHAGGALPYLIGRLDVVYENMPGARETIALPPSDYMSRLYYDSVTYRQSALQMCVDVGGEDNVMYGSDYPHNIGDMRGCLGRVDSLAASARRKVRGENARRIFNL